jgi:transposase-like protein
LRSSARGARHRAKMEHMASTRLPGVDIDPDLAQGLADLAHDLGITKTALIQRFIAEGLTPGSATFDLAGELVAARRELAEARREHAALKAAVLALANHATTRAA